MRSAMSKQIVELQAANAGMERQLQEQDTNASALAEIGSAATRAMGHEVEALQHDNAGKATRIAELEDANASLQEQLRAQAQDASGRAEFALAQKADAEIGCADTWRHSVRVAKICQYLFRVLIAQTTMSC